MALRILEVFREPLANGGQESFIMNMYRNMDHTKIVMDFLTPFTCDNPDLKKEIESYGGRVYACQHPFGQDENKVFRQCVRDFLKEHSYDVVHFHSGSTYALMEGPKLACEAGIPVRIVHSHCTGFDNLKYRVIKSLSVPYFNRYPTDFAACSNLAAAWKFPASIVRDQKYTLFFNAVDLDQFSFKPHVRRRMRQQLGLKDHLVIGHVGRFSQQKNHPFLLKIFAEILKERPDAVLLLAGDGEDFETIRQLAQDMQIDDHIRFLGVRRDVADLMNAMDVFVLPSLFEGLPVVGVEALACGLPVIASDTITMELPVPERCSYLSLHSEPSVWAKAAVQAAAQPRQDCRKELEEAGYEVHQAAKRMQNFYLEKAAQASRKKAEKSRQTGKKRIRRQGDQT